jgi:hypothetical protein
VGKRLNQEPNPEKKTFWRRHRWLLWLAGVAVLGFIAIGAVLGVVAQRFEPYLRARIVESLQDRFHTHVELDGFHVAVNNIRQGEWGIWATGNGLRIWQPTPVNGEQQLEVTSNAPMISLDSFSFHVPLRWQHTKTIHIGEIRLKGLRLRVPPRAPKAQSLPKLTAAEPDSQQPVVVIDRIVCDGADLLLETNKPGKLPMDFAIPHLTLTHVTPGGQMGYIANVVNPKPRGMVHAEGNFGPWQTDDPGLSPIDGKYHLDKADLGVFRGIGGLLTSDGQYTGTLRELHVTGTANVPDFRLSHFGNPMPLATRFVARVDGTDGDTWLDNVNATLGRSPFTTSGEIVRVRVGAPLPASQTAPSQTAQVDGRDIDLAINIAHGQIDDFLKLTSKSGNALLTGAVAVKAHLQIPPGHDEPLDERMKLDGTFQISGARFTSDKIQGRIQQLSLRGQGRPEDIKAADPTLVRSEMQGTFHMSRGVIALPDLEYNVPGADIQLKGSYALDGALNFTGTAKMQATVSQMVTGWKSLLLKPVDKFFSKDGAGTLVPITIQGTREAPKFNVDFSRINWKGTHPENPATKQQ